VEGAWLAALYAGNPNGATPASEWEQLNGELSKEQEGAMKRDTLVKHTLVKHTLVKHKTSMYVCSALMLLATLAGTPTDMLAGEATVQRLIFVSAGFNESNRFWTITRPFQLQFDPFLETLLDLDPKTGEYIPRLAEKWQPSPDQKEWTFVLRKGVPFHFGYGEFTAKDVVHTHSLMLRQEAIATFAGFWRGVEEIKVIDDYQVVFRMKSPSATLPYAVSRSGDLRMVSKAQWDKEGIEGFDKRPAGTGSYRYVARQLGQSISYERVDNHWRGETPAFKELEIRISREDSTRLAMLLRGEAHVVDLPRELQPEALKKGMKVLASQLPSEWVSFYFGGQYHLPGDPKFKADVPWNDRRVRQAMNMAVNRIELRDNLFKDKGTLIYVSGFAPHLEGWNPEWAQRFDSLYGYNPTKAKELLRAAGYAPGTLNAKIMAFTSPGEAELPQVAEAVASYLNDVGIQATLEAIDEAQFGRMNRAKDMSCCMWPNITGLRPTEELMRTAYYSKGNTHLFEDEFIEKKYLELTKLVDPQDRQRVAREIGDHLFEEFATIPLLSIHNEVAVNPKVVSEWTYPGPGAGRTTHFYLLKAAQ
jgi:peptide/nickel transport system substrate-binding protein